jgi:hypothetical protein
MKTLAPLTWLVAPGTRCSGNESLSRAGQTSSSSFLHRVRNPGKDGCGLSPPLFRLLKEDGTRASSLSQTQPCDRVR